MGRRRSSRPVGYAVGDVCLPFPEIERRKNSIGGFPTCSLNPLGGGKCWGSENHSQTDYRSELHGGGLLAILEAWHRLLSAIAGGGFKREFSAMLPRALECRTNPRRFRRQGHAQDPPIFHLTSTLAIRTRRCCRICFCSLVLLITLLAQPLI